MPPGGRREGAGRPKGTPNKRHQVTAKQIGYDEYLPIEYMLSLMRDEKAEATRRDQMAIQAAPYIHARLNAVSTSSVNGGSGGGDVNIVQVIGVPRGSLVDVKTGMITTIDGTVVTEPPELKPYDPTPALELTDQRVQTAVCEPLPVVELEPANVTRLDQYKAKRDDDDPA